MAVLLHPVLTVSTDRQAELSIARATATQFQCFVFDFNGLGSGGNGQSCVIDPAANGLHQSSGQAEIFPIELDLNQVRRQREHGTRGLDQVLKSFTERPVDFSVYHRSGGTDAYPNTQGTLDIHAKGSRVGIEGTHAPAMTIPIQYAAGPPVDTAETIADSITPFLMADEVVTLPGIGQ